KSFMFPTNGRYAFQSILFALLEATYNKQNIKDHTPKNKKQWIKGFCQLKDQSLIRSTSCLLIL
ncbi:hypothetical protein HKD02_004982, partial [Escherichia coli]